MNNKEQQDSNKTVFIDGVTYLIKENNTASVIQISNSIRDIFIPRSIKYETKEYIITSISKCSIVIDTTINSFQFAADSEVQTIEKNVFQSISIKNFSIPSKLTELKDGWCNQLTLDKITVSPDNPRYSMYNNQFIIGKSSIEQENYDVLIFCLRSIEGEIKIPDFIEIIGPHAFENCKTIQQFEFSPDSKLRIISNYSFSNTSIERISIPTKVKQICDHSFYCCKRLKEIEIQKNSELEMIGECAFFDSLIESISIPSKVTELKGGCFMGTKIDKIIISPNNSRYSLYEDQLLIGKSSNEQENYDVLINCSCSIEGKIKIPDFVEIISAYAFGNSNKIQTVEFSPDSNLRILEKGSFQLTSITSISIPSKLTELKDGWCNQLFLDKITVSPDNPRYSMYENQLLIGKSSIEQENYDVLVFCPRSIEGKIKIPDFIEIIGPNAFENCKKIQQVEFSPDSKLRIIGKDSFHGSSITSISIPPKVKIIGERSFQETDLLQKIDFHPNSILEKISCNAFDGSSIVNISLPSCLIEIEENAFYLTQNLFEVRFAEDSQLQIIGESAFASSEIKKINIPKHIKTISENCFEFSKIEQIDFQTDSELVFIEKAAFRKSNIQSIKIPKTVKIIGDDCFFFCKNLKNVEIPEDSELQTIEPRAFRFTGIQKIFIPKHVKILENEVFYVCNDLEQVDFAPDSELEIIKRKAFRLAPIEKISIPCHVKIIENEAFACEKLKHIEIPENSELEIIKQSAFSGSAIESFYIPSKLTCLEDGWLEGIFKIEKITVSPDNPRYSMYEDQFVIGKSSIEQENYDAFIFCPRSIEGKIKIPDFIEIIGPNAFEYCYKIQFEFSPDSKLRIIGNSSFLGAFIERISIPTKVTQICDQAFYGCGNLKKIEIPKNSELEIIGKKAFCGTLIESIYIPSKVTELKKDFVYETPILQSILVSSSNHLYSTCNEGKFIIKKSSIEQPNFDILAFCIDKSHCITIPSFIKVIEDGLFYSNENIREIHFQRDSKLEILGENAFERSNIEKISIPSSLKIIGLNCFLNCHNLKKLYIPDDSQLEVFDRTLYSTGITSLFIPRHIKQIKSGGFCMFDYLKIIEIDENCEIKTFDISLFDDIIVMISSKLGNKIIFTRINYEFRYYS